MYFLFKTNDTKKIKWYYLKTKLNRFHRKPQSKKKQIKYQCTKLSSGNYMASQRRNKTIMFKQNHTTTNKYKIR